MWHKLRAVLVAGPSDQPSLTLILCIYQLGISSGVYAAAASQAIYDSGGKSWCGSGCGNCYKLTSTGKAPCSGCGSGGAADQSIIVMVTNLCPHSGNEQ
jgi:endoglucanase